MTRELPAGAATVRDEAPVHVSPRARFEILGAVLLGLFLSALDQPAGHRAFRPPPRRRS